MIVLFFSPRIHRKTVSFYYHKHKDKNVEVEVEAQTRDIPQPNSPVVKKAEPEFAFISRIQDLMKKEVESKARDIDELQDLIREKEELESRGSPEKVHIQPKKQKQDTTQQQTIRHSDSTAVLNGAHVIVADAPLLSEKETQLLSSKVPPSVLRNDMSNTNLQN